jgi:hypothetical protein
VTRAPAVRNLVVGAIAAVAGVAVGASLSPTVAAWMDLGGTSMTITSIEAPPPEVFGPVRPGANTFIVSGPFWSGPNNTPNPTPKNSCFTVTVSSTAVTPTPWELRIYTDHPPFNNVEPFIQFHGQAFAEGLPVDPQKAPDYATSHVYLLTATQPAQYVSSGVNYTAKICAVNVPEPAWQEPGPDTYTQRPELELIRNGSQPCVGAIVDGHQPYFVGFTVSFDWKVFLDQQLALGAITPAEYSQWLNYTHWDGAPAGYEGGHGATGTDYLVTIAGYSEFGRNVAQQTPVKLGSCSY